MARGNRPQPVGQMAGSGKWTKSSRIWIPEVENSHRVRLARIQNELKIEDRAADDGNHNLPAKRDEILNEPQLDICGRVFSGILLLNQFLAEQLGSAVNQARHLLGHELNAQTLKDRIQSAVDTIFFDQHAGLLELRRADLASQRNLRHFRSKNALHHEAHYHDSLVWTWAIIFALFVGETLINGFLFGQVMSGGVAAGFIVAMMTSAINVATGLAAGLYGWRLLAHRDLRRRAAGLAIVIVLHPIALAWNVLVAHFREAAEAVASLESFDYSLAALTRATLEHINAYGFFGGIASLQSAALLLVGVLIHFYAAKKGWEDIADRYYDYRKYDERARQAHASFEDALVALRGEVREAVEDIEAEAREAAQNLRRIHNVMKDVQDLARQRVQEVKDSEDEWVSAGTQLLKAYRDINTSVRDPGSAPPYFDRCPSADDYRRRSFGAGPAPTEEVLDRADAVRQALNDLKVLVDVAETRAKTAEEMVGDIHRYITSAIKRVDKRLEQETVSLTSEAKQMLDDPAADGDAADGVNVRFSPAERATDEEAV